jgi:hypothetical protein
MSEQEQHSIDTTFCWRDTIIVTSNFNNCTARLGHLLKTHQVHIQLDEK